MAAFGRNLNSRIVALNSSMSCAGIRSASAVAGPEAGFGAGGGAMVLGVALLDGEEVPLVSEGQ